MKTLSHQKSVLFWLILFALMVMDMSALANDISGTYVGKGDNSVFLIQIVQTNDGNLTGRYEQVVLQPDGKLHDMNATITGATNGQTVVVTIKPSEFLAGNIATSGTIQGGLLHLTGGGSGSNLTLNLQKSDDDAEFSSHVANLTNQANQINETRRQQEAEKSAAEVQAKIEQQKDNFIAEANNLIRNMQVKNMESDKVIKHLLQDEAYYHAITSKVRSHYERCEQLSGYRNGVARDQIIVAMNQGVVATNQVDVHVQSIKTSFIMNVEPLLKELAKITHNSPNRRPKRVNAACQKLQDPGKAFRAKCKAVEDMLNRIEKTYQTELDVQQSMINRANHIQ